MTQELLQKQDSAQLRDLDPNVRQRQAASPDTSVWVSASAGTGKTKVLTDRVLRLLMPGADGSPGAKPHKILCLTFTKSAASEMALRINKMLGEWAVIPHGKLQEKLQNLLGRTPDKHDMEAARRLFADVVDTPGGLKIMTIHSFCQSVLGKFPLEAGLPPYFTVLEEGEAEAILHSARDVVLEKAEKENTSNLHQALQNIAKTINDEQFFKLIHDIASERHQFKAILGKTFGIDGLHTALCDALSIPVGINAASLLLSACQDKAFNVENLRSATTALLEYGTQTYKDRSTILGHWLSLTPEKRAQNFDKYVSVFLNKNGQPKASMASKKVPEEAVETLIKEQERLIAFKDQLNAVHCTTFTCDLLRLGEAVIDEYQALKTKKAALDFDDLIFKTADLFAKEGQASWVLYKLDQGLDHILIDEAQDTNPEQWKTVEALCDEFFTGSEQNDTARTCFTVGDEKQSIYSFQRASPEEFNRIRKEFSKKITTSGAKWNDLNLNISFRSTKAILAVVDSVFSNPALRKGLSNQEVQHHSFRRHQAGHVELWPLFEPEKIEELDPWTPPTQIIETRTGASLLAEHIAKTIRNWIHNEEILTSKNRPIHAGDILILMRTRSAFVNQLTRALKNHNIPVSGADRMVLNNQIAVQDLIAFAEFALLPGDNLTLASILKSPIIGIDEDALYELAVDRPSTLWQKLQKSKHKEIAAYLSNLIRLARNAHPYEFFSQLLQRPCPNDKMSGIRAIRGRLGDDALDPLDELLSTTLDFEHTHIPSLQKFLRWHHDNKAQIKREFSKHNSQVRIMTIHGAKGLQAPIVIMPDTMRGSLSSPAQIDKRLIWPDKSKLNVPLWSPRKDFNFSIFKTALNGLDERLEEEYRRLLYVAMTRAEDRLYVAGYQTRKKPIEESWYNYIKAGLQILPDHETLEDGTLRFTNPQTGDHEEEKDKIIQTDRYEKLPEWVHSPAPKEPNPPAPLQPSRPFETEKAITSPLHSDKTQRFTRGNLTHKLLEILPELPADKREKAAEYFLKRYGATLSDKIQNDILHEILSILKHPEFAPIFGPGSQAEVPITGLMPDSRVISGQIDRLLITETEIWIIDYKTNRKPPKNPTDVDDIYIKQLQAYADTLKQIYPEKIIHSALLWTDSPLLMPIDTCS